MLVVSISAKANLKMCSRDFIPVILVIFNLSVFSWRDWSFLMTG